MSDVRREWFSGVKDVVAEPNNFKIQLAIGEDAYKSLRLKNAVSVVWDTLGAAGTGATIAKLPIIASTFFPAHGMLAWMGIGTAVTPVGWVIGAAVVAGGAWIGITKFAKAQTAGRTTVIPEFINTPLDVIGLALFDLMAPLALKVAKADGSICEKERAHIEHWFIKTWGFSPDFVKEGLAFVEANLDDIQVKEIATALCRYKKDSPDCNYNVMSQKIIGFLNDIALADDEFHEQEEFMINNIEKIFNDEGRLNIGDCAYQAGKKVAVLVKGVGDAADSGISAVRNVLTVAKGSVRRG